jgi:type II secretory pathway pseudopilin PulG
MEHFNYEGGDEISPFLSCFLLKTTMIGEFHLIVEPKECVLRLFRSIMRFPRSGKAKRSFWRRMGIAGVTLLELFIVIEIIGFLATIVMSNYFRSKKAAEVAVTLQNIKNVQIALTSHFAMTGSYPASLNTIWLQFYNGRVVADLEYVTGTGDQAGWIFLASNDPDIQFGGLMGDTYAIKSNENLQPYALYVYGDVATAAKIVH